MALASSVDGMIRTALISGRYSTISASPFTNGQANVNVVQPGTQWGDRLNQIDLRFTKVLNLGKGKLDLNADFYNAFNSDAVLTELGTFGPLGEHRQQRSGVGNRCRKRAVGVHALWVAERGALTALQLEEVGRPFRSDGFAGAVDGIQYRPWQWALLHR